MTGGLAAAVTAELELLLRATLLVGAAWASAVLLRRAGASASARHVAWLLGIAALLALPLLWWLVPSVRLPVLPMGAEGAPGLAPPSALAFAAPAPDGSTPFDKARIVGWDAAFPLAYGLVAVALLLRLVIGRLMLSRLWRDADPVREPGWERLLARLSREAFLSRPVQLRFARGPAMPMTWGTLAPKLLLPAEAQGWPAERQRLVLLHELAHVARRDSLSRTAAALACALYWFHPGVWFAAREMRMEQEQAADDRVLIAGASPLAYARSLLDLATEIGGRPQPEPAASMAGACQLERRLLSITMPAKRDRITPFHLSASAAFGGLLTLVMAVGVPVSVSSARLSTLPATPPGIAPPTGHGLASPPSQVRPEDEARAPVSDGLERPTATGSIASQRRPTGNESPAGSQEMAGRERAVADAAAPIGQYEARSGPGAGQAAPPSRLLIYADWQLPPRDSNGLRNGGAATPFSGYSARAERVALPPAPDAVSGARAERRKPPAFALRIGQTGPITNRPVPTPAPAAVALTWSLETTKR